MNDLPEDGEHQHPNMPTNNPTQWGPLTHGLILGTCSAIPAINIHYIILWLQGAAALDKVTTTGFLSSLILFFAMTMLWPQPAVYTPVPLLLSMLFLILCAGPAWLIL